MCSEQHHGHIAQTYGLSGSAVCRTVRAVEAALMRSGAFRLLGKKALTRSEIRRLVVDATECPVERPQKSSGAPTAARRSAAPPQSNPQEARPAADQKTRMILATAFSTGRAHDFKLFKRSRTAMPPQTRCLADSGHLGLAKQHGNSQTPHKSSKLHLLTGEQKAQNRRLTPERMVARAHHPEPEGLAPPERALPLPAQAVRPALQPDCGDPQP